MIFALCLLDTDYLMELQIHMLDTKAGVLDQYPGPFDARYNSAVSYGDVMFGLYELCKMTLFDDCLLRRGAQM